MKEGLCLDCKRYFPPSVSSCRIAKEGVRECRDYLQREKKKKKVVRKRDPEFIPTQDDILTNDYPGRKMPVDTEKDEE